MLNYRSDIDGLRAISVIAVIIFHVGFNFLSGGYVGVDVFFVISGFLITGLVLDDVKAGKFTFSSFYKRRLARLLPALIITLLSVLIFGFLFYDNNSFDNLGKEIFFSAFGAANILFGQGVNYFAQEEAVRPLIHLWSLGVEEQFYLVWPTVLIFIASFKNKHILFLFVLLFLISFLLALLSVESSPTSTYFYPQYRAFELIVGALVAVWVRSQFYLEYKVKNSLKELIAYFSILLIIFSMVFLDKNSTFPGVNTLYPIIGAAFLITYGSNTSLSKILGFKPLVFIGLISYPLYLFHQPVISYLHFFGVASSKLLVLLVVLGIAIPLAWLTYIYIEKPIRRSAHKKANNSKFYYMGPLFIIIISFSGLYVAKHNGVGDRFKLLNAFAYNVTKHSESTFHNHFERGMVLTKGDTEKILFVGDSLAQQYVYPMSQALGFDTNNVDVVSRGGCVLLKGVDFLDIFSDISCNDLRENLYKHHSRHYKYIIFTQNWNSSSYAKSVLNFKKVDDKDDLTNWSPFIRSTIEHFKPMADKIIVIGGHPNVKGTSALKPTIFLSQESYKNNLKKLKVTNEDQLIKAKPFFNQWEAQKIFIFHPADLWLTEENKYKLHGKDWSYFMDSIHMSNSSKIFVTDKLRKMLVN